MGDAIPFEQKKAIEDVACYMVRAPLSLKKLVALPPVFLITSPRNQPKIPVFPFLQVAT